MNENIVMRENVRAFIKERKKRKEMRASDLIAFACDVFSEYPEEIIKEELIREKVLPEEE